LYQTGSHVPSISFCYLHPYPSAAGLLLCSWELAFLAKLIECICLSNAADEFFPFFNIPISTNCTLAELNRYTRCVSIKITKHDIRIRALRQADASKQAAKRGHSPNPIGIVSINYRNAQFFLPPGYTPLSYKIIPRISTTRHQTKKIAMANILIKQCTKYCHDGHHHKCLPWFYSRLID
jgi:hypothetical protein